MEDPKNKCCYKDGGNQPQECQNWVHHSQASDMHTAHDCKLEDSDMENVARVYSASKP